MVPAREFQARAQEQSTALRLFFSICPRQAPKNATRSTGSLPSRCLPLTVGALLNPNSRCTWQLTRLLEFPGHSERSHDSILACAYLSLITGVTGDWLLLLKYSISIQCLEQNIDLYVEAFRHNCARAWPRLCKITV